MKINKKITLLVFCISLSSCTTKYNYIQEYFTDTIKTTKFLVHRNDTNLTDTIQFYEKIKRSKRSIEYNLQTGDTLHYDQINISINPRFVSVTADSSDWFINLFDQKYVRSTIRILKPKYKSLKGFWKENDSDTKGHIWPHPYNMNFSFENDKLIIHKFTTRKLSVSNTYYFSREQGLYKMVENLNDSVFIFIYTKNQ